LRGRKIPTKNVASNIFGREGYAVCSGNFTEVTHGFDAGTAEGGFGAPTVSQPNGAGKLPLIITRESLDGRERLTQKFTLIPADREVQIEMTVKNISSSQLLFLGLDRYFDGDIDLTSSDDRYDRTRRDSVWGVAIPPGLDARNFGVMLTQSPSAIASSEPAAEKFATWDPMGREARALAVAKTAARSRLRHQVTLPAGSKYFSGQCSQERAAWLRFATGVSNGDCLVNFPCGPRS